MPTYNDYGIVLNNYNFSESDKILNIYTKGNGLVRAICKGVRKPTSRFSGRADQFTCAYFHFAKGKNLDIVSECEQINSFSYLRKDLTRLTYGILFLEVVNSFAHEQESESNHTYDLLYTSLEKLQVVDSPELFSISFLIEFLSIHGFCPQFETCVSCSQEILRSASPEIRYPYSSVLGGLLCKNCLNLNHKLISQAVIKVLSVVETRRWHVFTIEERENIRKALDLLKEHINARAKNNINSFDMVFSL